MENLIREKSIMRRVKVFVLVGLVALGLVSPAPAQLPPITKGDIGITLQSVATGLGAPDYVTAIPDDSARQFILDQQGLIRVVQNGSLLPTPALDVRTQVNASGFSPASGNDERGLLGLAFHPDFNRPGTPGFHKAYTYESEGLTGTLTFPVPVDPMMGGTNRYRNVIVEWTVDPATNAFSSRREVLSLGKDASNHNGGTITFGRDGYLYLGTGDGGNANDRGPGHIEATMGNAQNLTNALGKMLRIDPLNPALTDPSRGTVSANGQYRNPNDNPFTGAGELREIYAYGLRNPYRFAFDRGPSNQLIVADVGQNTIEEIDRIVRGGNYGWAIKEGDFLFNRLTGAAGPRSPGSPPGLIDPISGPRGTLEYSHVATDGTPQGISIIGGFVYRGTAIPELEGKYIFGDLAITGARLNARIFFADLDTGEMHELLLPQFPDGLPFVIHGFGEDADGELYVEVLAPGAPSNGTGGIVFRITPVPEPGSLTLLGIGVASLLGYGWRRWKRRVE
jgi:glucose/arabinose dehydrogenase